MEQALAEGSLRSHGPRWKPKANNQYIWVSFGVSDHLNESSVIPLLIVPPSIPSLNIDTPSTPPISSSSLSCLLLYKYSLLRISSSPFLRARQQLLLLPPQPEETMGGCASKPKTTDGQAPEVPPPVVVASAPADVTSTPAEATEAVVESNENAEESTEEPSSEAKPEEATAPIAAGGNHTAEEAKSTEEAATGTA
ncbi:unnamed protein product [Musa acuminata subsp. malaccensis]|uniref:(wild Malaysian banana) hypothetical protein n=1 Tax=Musa acuminata subsp. malaccensis TaxID=214687 RepID=A0A804IL65_MUSAM|nr:unnamed protein product [Musa acuminata subsp. malaccensis]